MGKINLSKIQLEILLPKHKNKTKPAKKEFASDMNMSERQFYRYLKLANSLRHLEKDGVE